MEIFFAAIGKAVLSLTGPVAKFAYRRTGRKHWAALADELSEASERRDERALALTQRLKSEGVSQRELVDLSAFCRSDEGGYCCRMIAINTLAGSPVKGEAAQALTLQVAAMIRLSVRRADFPHADEAAAILVEEASKEVRDRFGKLRSRDPEVAREIRDMAVEQARLPDMFRALHLRARTKAIYDLIDQLPSEVEQEIEEYCALTEEAAGQISIAGVNRTLRIPVSKGLVNSDVHYREGAAFPSDPSSSESVLPALLSKHSHIVLLGDPGGGKSTAVQAAIHEYAAAAVKGDTRVVPFLITLRQYARAMRRNDELGFVAYLHQSIKADHDECMSLSTIRYLLHTGRAVVFFDGLDEILDVDTRRVVATRIDKFARRFAGSGLVVTSRTIGYDQVPVESRFEHFELEAFGVTQVRAFASNVFAAASLPDRDHHELLGEFMAESEAVNDIRSNPLMLGILCYLFASGRTMPTSRLELYRRCAELLFDTWDEHRGILLKLDDSSAAEQAVRELALQIFESGEEEIGEGHIKHALAEFYVEAQTTVPAFRGRTFADEVFKAWTGRKWILAFAGEQFGEKFYRFAHRTFLEFFAADQIAFECETSVEAWERTKGYIEVGAATPFCQLVLQIMDSKTKGAADKFVSSALDSVEGSFENPEDAHRGFNVLAFLTMSIGGIKTSPEVRDRLLAMCFELFANLVPWVNLPEVDARGSVPFVGYRSVFTEEDSVLIDDDALDELGPQGFKFDSDSNIDTVSIIFKSLIRLPFAERARLLETADRTIRTRISRDRETDAWLRLALAMKQLPNFESWRSMPEDWKQQLREFGDALWDFVLDWSAAHEHAATVDFWLLIALLRDQGISDPAALKAIGMQGIFVGGWPLPVLEMVRGTVAHTLLLAALGLEAEEWPRRWNDAEVDALCSTLTSMIDEVGGRPMRFDKDQAQHAPAVSVRPSRAAAESSLTRERELVSQYLAVSLDQHGDGKFVGAVMRAVRSDRSRESLRKAINGAEYVSD